MNEVNLRAARIRKIRFARRTEVLRRKTPVALPMVIYGAIYMLCFCALENVRFGHYTLMYVPVDEIIPFNDIFIIPYLFWFLLVPSVLLYLLLYDEPVFRKTCWLLALGMTAFLVISAVYPTMLHLRPYYVPGTDLCARMVRWLYATDPAINVFPSIHVYNTCAVLYGVYQSSGRLFRKDKFRIAVTSICIAIVMSTLFLKQHSVLDVAGAFVMLGGFVFLIERVGEYFTAWKDNTLVKTKPY